MTDAPLKTGVAVIKHQMASLPEAPGVYRMLAEDETVLYVGKAKSLKKRVVAYTRPEALPIRLQRMVALTRSMVFVVTDSEQEALLLESNLIKKLKPRYNILLRDDKAYPYIFIPTDHPYPAMGKHRGARARLGHYFGPFGSAGAVDQTLEALQKAFLLRSCQDHDFAHRTRPCLQYQIKRCTAPCVGYVSKEDYADQVSDAVAFLKGKNADIQKKLSEIMYAASAAQDFEMAAFYRDRIASLSRIQQHQNVHTAALGDADILAMARGAGKTCIQVFFFRGGSHYGNRVFFPKHGEDSDDATMMGAFLAQFYTGVVPPSEILVSVLPKDQKVLQDMLHQCAGHAVSIVCPKRGEKHNIVAACLKNAEAALARDLSQVAHHQDMLARIGQVFDLPHPPQRIELYDNSHIQGAYALGAMVVVGPAGFEPSAYRTYKMNRQDLDTRDDYAMMRQMLHRRLTGNQALPDLMIIDGGAGQLSAVLEVFVKHAVDIPVVAMAKGPDRNAGREVFYQPSKPPMTLDPRDPVLYDLQRLRDEVHRFAITRHRKRREKSLRESALDDIAGVGPSRKRALLSHFGSTDAVKKASLQDLERAPTISKTLAKKIFEGFQPS